MELKDKIKQVLHEKGLLQTNISDIEQKPLDSKWNNDLIDSLFNLHIVVRQSEQLKEKQIPEFEDWLKDTYIKTSLYVYQHRLYHFKKSKEQCLKIYNILHQNL